MSLLSRWRMLGGAHLLLARPSHLRIMPNALVHHFSKIMALRTSGALSSLRSGCSGTGAGCHTMQRCFVQQRKQCIPVMKETNAK